LEISV